MSMSEHGRRRIDTGRTGEKVPFPDPAAAPAASDAEAGGAAPTDDRGHPAATKPLHAPALSDESGRRIDGTLTRTGARRTAVLTVAGLALIAVLGLAWGLAGVALR